MIVRLRPWSVVAALVVVVAASGFACFALTSDDGEPPQRPQPPAVGAHARLTSVLGWPGADLTSRAMPRRADWVALTTHDGLAEPWRMLVYRSIEDAMCMALAPRDQRAKQVGCGSPYVTAQELRTVPINTVSATAVDGGSHASMLVVAGLAAPNVRTVRVLDGAARRRPAASLTGPTLRVPFQPGQTLRSTDGATTNAVEVRPFLLSWRDPHTPRVVIRAAASDGTRASYTAPIARSHAGR